MSLSDTFKANYSKNQTTIPETYLCVLAIFSVVPKLRVYYLT